MVHATRTRIGNCMDPHASWMLVRGLKTLAVRVARQNENALRVAEFLSEHAKVRSVHYPFLKTHPQYAVAREQMSGGGGRGGFEREGTGGGRPPSQRIHAAVYPGAQPGRSGVAGIDPGANLARHDRARPTGKDGR